MNLYVHPLPSVVCAVRVSFAPALTVSELPVSVTFGAVASILTLRASLLATLPAASFTST